jgi:hypothetical protein
MFKFNRIYINLFLTLGILSGEFISQNAFSALRQIKADSEVVFSEKESAALTKELPKVYQNLLTDETEKNPYFYGDESRIVESSVTRGERLTDVNSLERLGDYDPRKGRWFYLPHLEIPFDDFQRLNISPSMSPEMKKLYFFNRDGVKYVRYFLHPFRELKNYTSLIRKYDLKYQYLARPISSPRSMIVMKENDPGSPQWVKVSLGLTMSALQRRQKPEKLARALMINEALDLIPQATRDELKLDWMNESFAAQLPGKEEVIIGRDVRTFDEHEGDAKKLRSTFSFFHSPDGKKAPDVKRMIEVSGLSEIEFFKKYFLYPAINDFIYLAFEEGVIWSMHTGNYYTEVNSRGLPTGKLVVKDFDGAAFDPEIRMLRGKPFSGIHQMTENPFSDAWFAAATGRSNSDRQRVGYVYTLYIRDVYGFNSIASYVFSYLSQWGRMKNKSRADVRNVVETAIDEITSELIGEYTGIKVSGLGKGYGTDSGINVAYNEWRRVNQLQYKRSDLDPEIQKDLKWEFIRLMKMNRSWASFTRSNVTEAKRRLNNENVIFLYHEHAGMIEARSYSGKNSENFTTIGYALIEDPRWSDNESEFLKEIRARRPAKEEIEVDIEEILRNESEKPRAKVCSDLLSWLKDFGMNIWGLEIVPVT